MKKQHTEHILGAKLKQRSRFLSYLESPVRAAYIPYFGEGDIAHALYSDYRIYGADVNEDFLITARRRLPEATLLNADIEAEYPFAYIETPITLADFDAYAEPYTALKHFLEKAVLDTELVLFGTQSCMVMRQRRYYEPSQGENLPLSRPMTVSSYYVKVVKPYLTALLEHHNYQVRRLKRFQKGRMLYWALHAEADD